MLSNTALRRSALTRSPARTRVKRTNVPTAMAAAMAISRLTAPAVVGAVTAAEAVVDEHLQARPMDRVAPAVNNSATLAPPGAVCRVCRNPTTGGSEGKRRACPV